jgi:hypothetical protein
VSDFVIPPCGLEDVDTAIFSLFDKELPLAVGGGESAELKKVPVIFAGGEKWALLKRNRPLRDKSNSLILPLITIGRTGFSQTTSEDLAGRGINQKTGEIVIRRRLDKSDRNYQNLINRIFLKNQSNLSMDARTTEGNQLTTLNEIGELQGDPTIVTGGLMLPDKLRNVIETIVVPSPQFITANYEITVWTQYTHHMNQVMETMISSFLPQMQGWKIVTPKGYWFLAQMADESFTAETNFDDMSQGERLIKQKFAVKVHAYIFASNSPGTPIPVKRYVSSPSISFVTGIATPGDPLNTNSTIDSNIIDDPFLGADDPTLPLNDVETRARRDSRRTGGTRLYSQPFDENDPARAGYARGTRPAQYRKFMTRLPDGKLAPQFVRVVNVNSSTGETTYAPGTDLSNLTASSLEE